MGKVKHRDELIKKIRNIDDKNVIDEIFRLLEINFDDSVYQLNKSQMEEISTAREEIKSGKTISAEEADKEIDEWLEK